jgi:glycosyltransferase involved in cell wall biosynthesis
MVGEGPQFEIAKRIVDNSELMTKNIHLVGYSDNVHNYLSFFDCFLLTSKVEGLPNVIIEAQTHSIPVVSTNAGGSAECFIEGVTGFLAKNNDIFELEKLVLKVLSDPKIKQNIKKKAPKFIKERFGRKVYSANINKLYTRQYI